MVELWWLRWIGWIKLVGSNEVYWEKRLSEFVLGEIMGGRHL